MSEEEFINVIKLEWNDNLFNISDGLWCNNGYIALHLPNFKKNNIKYSNYNYYQIAKKMYIKYEEKDYIEKMKFYYYNLNDIVFLNKTWNNLKKSQIYIEAL